MRWLLSLLVFIQPLHATVLIQGTETSRIDYRAALKANPDLEAPSQAYRRAHPLGSSRDAVMETFASAQKAFLENSRTEAIEKLTQVTRLSTLDDWSTAEREIFISAYLRLAQLENDPVKQREWLAHSLTVGAPADATLFPPPLLKLRAALERELPRIEIPRKWFQEGWTNVLINGQVCNRDRCDGVAQTSTPIRVTFLSEQWIPFSTVTSAAAIALIKPKRTAWYEGSCGAEKFHAAAQVLGDRKTLCESPLRSLDLNPVASHSENEIPRMEIREKGDAFYSNPWFWTGVGVAVAAILVAVKQAEDRREPTTTYGHQ